MLFRAYDEQIQLSQTPADTTGSVVSLSPDWVIGASSQQLHVQVTVGEHGIAEGGGVKVSLGHILPTEQRIYTPFSITVTSAYFFGINYFDGATATTGNDDVRLKVHAPKPGRFFKDQLRYVRYKRSDGKDQRDGLLRQIDNEFALWVEVKHGSLKPGDTIDIVLGGKKGVTAPKNEASWDVLTRVDGDGDGTFGLLADTPTLESYGATTRQVVLVTPSTLNPGEQSHMVLRTQDDYFLPNLTRYTRAELRFDPIPGLELPTEMVVDGSLESWDKSVIELPISATATGVYRVTGTAIVDGQSFSFRSNPIEVVPEGTPHIYFGDLHIHSCLSYDADRTPEYVWWRQRYQERHDFAALSDHDMIGAAPFAERDGFAGRTPDEWAYAKSLANSSYKPGEFVSIFAYEWTSYYFGHRNIFFAPHETDPPLFHHNYGADYPPGDEENPEALHGRLEGVDYIAIPHSTAWYTKNMLYTWSWGDSPEGTALGDPTVWPEQRLLELYSTHGTSEYFDNEYAVDKGHQEIPTDSNFVESLLNYVIKQAPAGSGNFAQEALAHGWKTGFIGSSDDHYLSHIDQAYKYGLAAIYADDLTREGIWEGMMSRQSFAVTGVRILLHFDANGAPMGSELPWSGGPLSLRGEIHGVSDLDKVEVVRWDGSAWTEIYAATPTGLDASVEVTDPDAKAGDLYYLRVRQKDGNRAWSSPIWLVTPTATATPEAAPTTPEVQP